MTTYKLLSDFRNTLVKLTAQTNYNNTQPNYKVGRIKIAFSNVEKVLKDSPLRLEDLTSRQFKCLGFQNIGEYYTIPYYVRFLLPDNLEVFIKGSDEAYQITAIDDSVNCYVIPYKIKYIQPGLSEGFWYYIRHGHYPK